MELASPSLPPLPPPFTIIILRCIPGGGKSFLCNYFINLIKLQNSSDSSETSKFDSSAIENSKNSSNSVIPHLYDSPSPISSSFTYCSADEYFLTSNDFYHFDSSKLGAAHAYCLNRIMRAIEKKSKYLIVDNTHAEKWQYSNILKLAEMFNYSTKIFEIKCADEAMAEIFNSRNLHNVPLSVSLKMKNIWEIDESATIIEPKLSAEEWKIYQEIKRKNESKRGNRENFLNNETQKRMKIEKIVNENEKTNILTSESTNLIEPKFSVESRGEKENSASDDEKNLNYPVADSNDPKLFRRSATGGQWNLAVRGRRPG